MALFSSFAGSAFDSDDRTSFISSAVSPAVTQPSQGASQQQLPHERLRKKLFGSKWQRPVLSDSFWLCSHLRDAAELSGDVLSGTSLVASLRKLKQLEGLRDESLLALVDAPAFNYNTSSEMYVRWPAILREATIATDEVDSIVASLRQQAAAETTVNTHYRFQFQQECQALSREGASPFTPKSLRRLLRDTLALKATSSQAAAIVQDINGRGIHGDMDEDAAASFGGVVSARDVGLWLQTYVEDAVAAVAAAAAAETGAPTLLSDAPVMHGSQSRVGTAVCDLRLARGTAGCALLAQHGFSPVPGIVASCLQDMQLTAPDCTVAQLVNTSGANVMDHSSASDGVLSISSLSLQGAHRQDAAAAAVSLNYQAYGDALYLYRKSQPHGSDARRSAGDDAPDVCDILLSDSTDDRAAEQLGFQLLAEESTNEGAELTPRRHLLLRRQSAVPSRHVPPVLVDVLTVVYNASARGDPAARAGSKRSTDAVGAATLVRDVPAPNQTHADLNTLLRREGYVRVAGNCNEGNPGPEIAVWFRRQYAIPADAEANTEHGTVLASRKQEGVLALSLAMRRLSLALLLWESENVAGKGGKGGNLFNVGNGRGVLTAQLALRQAFNQATRGLGSPAGHMSDAALVAMLTQEAPYLVSPVPELPLGVSADVPAGHLAMGLSSAAAVDAVAALDPRGEDEVQRRVFAQRALWGWGAARTGDLPSTAAAVTYTVLLSALSSRLAEGWTISSLVRFVHGWVVEGTLQDMAQGDSQGTVNTQAASGGTAMDDQLDDAPAPPDDDVFSSDGISDSESDSDAGNSSGGADKASAEQGRDKAPAPLRVQACKFPPSHAASAAESDAAVAAARLHEDELLGVLRAGARQEEPAAHPCAVAGVAREVDALPGAGTGHRVVDIVDALWALGAAAVRAWQVAVLSEEAGHGLRPSQTHVQWGAALVQIGLQEAQHSGAWKSTGACVDTITSRAEAWGVEGPPLNEAGELDAHVLSDAMHAWCVHAPVHEVLPRACVFAILPLMGLGGLGGAIGADGWHLVLEVDVVAHAVFASAVDARARAAGVLLSAGLLSFAQQRSMLWCLVRPSITMSQSVAPQQATDCVLDTAALLRAVLGARLDGLTVRNPAAPGEHPDGDAASATSHESSSDDSGSDDSGSVAESKSGSKPGREGAGQGLIPFAAADTHTLLQMGACEALLEAALRAFTGGAPPPAHTANPTPTTRSNTSSMLAAGSSLWGAVGDGVAASVGAAQSSTSHAYTGQPTLRLGDELASSSGGVRSQASSAAWAAGVQLQSQLSADSSLVAVPALGGVERMLLQAQLHAAAVGQHAVQAAQAWIVPAVMNVLTGSLGKPSSASGIFGPGAAVAGGFGGAMSPVSIWGDGSPDASHTAADSEAGEAAKQAAMQQNVQGVVVQDRPIPGGCIQPNAISSWMAPREKAGTAVADDTLLLQQPLQLAGQAPAPRRSAKRSKNSKKGKRAAAAATRETAKSAAAAAATELAPGMDRTAVQRHMLVPVMPALQQLGASIACGCLGPLDKGVLGPDTGCSITQQVQICAVTAIGDTLQQPKILDWLAGAALSQHSAALHGMQMALRRTGADAAAGMAGAIAACLSAVVPGVDAGAVSGALSVPDLLAAVRGAAPLLPLGVWPVQRWLPAMQQGMLKACCANALYVCSPQQWADATAAPAPEAEASSDSDEGHVQGVILGGSSSEEEAPPASDDSGVVSSSGDEDESDGASSHGSGASSVSGAPPAQGSSSDSEESPIQSDVAADAMISSLQRLSGATAIRKAKRLAGTLLLPAVPCAALEGDGSLRRKRKAMQAMGDIVKPVQDALPGHCMSAALLDTSELISAGGALAHEVQLVPPGDQDRTALSAQRKALKKKGFVEVVKLPARTGALWLRSVQVAGGERAGRKAVRRAGGKGAAAADALQVAADKWAKAATKAVRYAATDAVLTQALHERRAKGGSGSRPPSVAGAEAAATYGHVAPDEMKRCHSADGNMWVPPSDGGQWVCVGGWRVNSDGLQGGAKSASTVLWLRWGNKGRDKAQLAASLAAAVVAAVGPVPDAPPSHGGSSGSDTSGSELPEDDALVPVPQAALQDGDRVVPSLSNPSSHLPTPADAWGSQLVPKGLRRLLPRCQRRYQRLFAAGSVPLNPLSVFVPDDKDGSGTLDPALFGEVVRARLLGLGLRGEAELAELLRALQHASCLGQERSGERRRVSKRMHIDYVMFSRLLMSPESQALGVVVAARVRVGLLAHSRAKALGQRARVGTVRDVLQQFVEEEAGGSRSQYHSSGAGHGLRGRIALGDLARGLQALGIAVSASHMVPLCRALGLTPDSAGRLDVDTFVRVVMAGTGVVPWTQGGVSLLSSAARAARSRLREAAWISASSDIDVAAAFRAVDPRGKGVLGRGELKSALNMLGVALSGSDFDALMAALDTNDSGKIGFSEFVRLIELDGGELAATHRLLHSHLVASAAEGDNALARVRAAYSAFDGDEVGSDIGAGSGSGSIPLRAFVAATRTAGLPLTPMATVLLARRFALPGTRCVDEGRGGYTSGALGFDVSYSRFLAWAFGQSPQDVMAVSDSALGAAAGGPMAGLAEAHDPAAPPPVPDVWRSVRAVSAAGGGAHPPAVAGSDSSGEDGPVQEGQLRRWLQDAMRGQAKNGTAPDGSPAARRGDSRGRVLQSPGAGSRLPSGSPVRPSAWVGFEDSQAAAAAAAMAADAPGALTPRTLQRLRGIGAAGVPEARAMALKHMAPRRRAAFLIDGERQKRWQQSGVWICKTCSYQNRDYARKCFMCLSACPHSVSAAGEDWSGAASMSGDGKDEDGSVSKDLSGIMDAAGGGTPATGRRPWQYGQHMAEAGADPLGAFGSPRRELDTDANRGLHAWQEVTARGLDRDMPRRTRAAGAGGAAFDGTAPSAGPGQLLEAAGQAGMPQQRQNHGQHQYGQGVAPVDDVTQRQQIGTPMGSRGHGPYRRPPVPYAQDHAGDGFAAWSHSSAASLPSHTGPAGQYGQERFDAQSSTPAQPLPSSFPMPSHRQQSHSQSAWPQVPQPALRGDPAAHSFGAGLGVHPRGSSTSSVDDWGHNFGPGAASLSGRPAREEAAIMDPLRASGADLVAMAQRGGASSTPHTVGATMTPSRGSADLTSAMGQSSAGMRTGALGWHALASGPYMDAPPAALGGTPSAARAALGSSMGLGSPGSTSRGVRPDYMAMAAASSLQRYSSDSQARAATSFATGKPTLPPRHGSLHRASGSFFE